MVRAAPAKGSDVSNRGVLRARIIFGGLVLFAAIVSWFTTLMMSPHGEVSASGGDHVRSTVVVFIRNSAIGNLILSGLSGWLLFPPRRPHSPRRDWVLIGVIGVIAATSLYQLFWLRSVTG
jgi:hypothetical protein